MFIPFVIKREDIMNKLIALSLSIGGIGGIMTWIYTSTPLALSIPISFIAWACFVAALLLLG